MSVLGVENCFGIGSVTTCQLDAATHVARHIRRIGEIEPASLQAFVVRWEGVAAHPVHPENVVEVLRVIAVDMDDRTRHVHPGQSSGDRVDTALFEHFSDGAVGRVLPRFDYSGDWRPCLVVRPLDQKHLPIANDHCGYPDQPQRGMTDVLTKRDDELRNRHTHLSNRDSDAASLLRTEVGRSPELITTTALTG
jgi:hypothetical protein